MLDTHTLETLGLMAFVYISLLVLISKFKKSRRKWGENH